MVAEMVAAIVTMQLEVLVAAWLGMIVFSLAVYRMVTR